MATVRLGKGNTVSRVKKGAAVLTAAKAVDTRPVKERLERFEQAHRNYVGAQKKVEAVEALYTSAMTRVNRCHTAQAAALDAVARALITDGHPRHGNPFADLGLAPPTAMLKLPFADGAKAVHHLTATILVAKDLSKATIDAAQSADHAATALEEALVPIAKLEASVRDARGLRDAMGQGWDTAYGALRRGARIAADDGAPELYGTLFPVVSRGTKPKAPAEGATGGAPPPEGASNAA